MFNPANLHSGILFRFSFVLGDFVFIFSSFCFFFFLRIGEPAENVMSSCLDHYNNNTV